MYNTFSLIEGKHRLLFWNHINLWAKIYGAAGNTFLMCEDGERKWNQIRDEKHLGLCPHSCIKTYYAANFSATIKNDKRTMAHTLWFWQISIRTFCTFPWFLNVHRNIPSFNVDSCTVSKHFHVSPPMQTVCDWHISAHQNASPERKALTQNKHLTSKPPPTPFKES